MDRVKSLFSASLWCAKASTISKRLNKHFFKGYLDVSHLGGGVGAFNINTWIKVGRLPSLLPEHQDLWLHLGLCIPILSLQEVTPKSPPFFSWTACVEDCRLQGGHGPWRHTTSEDVHDSGLQSHGCSDKMGLQVCCTQELYPRAVRCCLLSPRYVEQTANLL